MAMGMNEEASIGTPPVPFVVERHGGLAEVHGTIQIANGKALELEFETRDSLSGLLRSDSVETLALTELANIMYRRGWIGGKLIFESKTIEAIRPIAWRSGHRFQLSIRRRHREQAKTLADDISWLLENSAETSHQPPPSRPTSETEKDGN